MITDLILKGIEGLVRIGTGAYEDKQKREAEQLAELQTFYERGAAETAALSKAFSDTSTEARAAFAAARERLKAGG